MRTPLMIGTVVLLAASPALAQQPPFYVQSVRQICQLPRPNNNGRVVGHDNGWSVKYNGTSYFFFADTLLDGNGNDGLDPADGTGSNAIFQGTVASTTDHRAKNCIDLTDYKNDGGTATSLFPDSDKSSTECALWPAGGVVANGQLYLYGSAPTPCPTATHGCADECIQYPTFLAKFDATTRTAHRLATGWSPTEPQFNFPTLVTHSDGTKWVYVIGSTKNAGSLDYLLARVPQAQIETKSAYQYKSGSTWVTNNPAAATALFEEYGGGQMSIVYNKYLKRFLMTYTCGFATEICGRTAVTSGSDESAIGGQWSDEVVLYQCPRADGLACYAAFQHGQFAKRAIYVTTARLSPLAKKCTGDADCQCDGSPAYSCVEGKCAVPVNLQRRYGITLHEILLSKKPPLTPIARFESASSYSPRLYCEPPQQGIGRWFYDQLKNGSLGSMTFDYTWNWIGTETSGGFPVPQIDQDSMVPTATAAAVRLWQPLYGSNGLIRITGEARKKFSCGGQVHVDAIRVAATGKISTLWSADLKPTARTAIANFTTNLNVGDSIGFRTSGGTDPACDRVVFSPLIQK